jgi:glycosyltransferase involved in cell wall biosynthesis
MAEHTTQPAVRLLVIQFGDYRQALLARERGQPETYRAQYYSMACFEKFCAGGEALIICLDTEPYDWTWHNFRLVGGRFVPSGRGLAYLQQVWQARGRLIDWARTFAPTHLIIRTPAWPMLWVGRWARRHRIPVLPLFADYFYTGGIKTQLKNAPLIRLLNHPAIPVVANHNYPACASMVRAGVKAGKVVPYDWPALRSPQEVAPKTLAPGSFPYRLVYAGQISHQKGVGDLLEAVALLHKDGLQVELDLFGEGPEKAALTALAAGLGLAHTVRFHGLAANEQVLVAMRAAQLVVVPSRHAYPEGIPCVIYEALEMRTPVVLSDHPSFLPKLRDRVGCLIFRAGEAVHLAARIHEALTQPGLYAALSADTAVAWQAIQCPVTFGQLLDDWLAFTRGGGELACQRFSLAARQPAPLPAG